MLVHKGSQINNGQLITGLRIAEMSQLQNCSVMSTKNGSYCENEKKREKVRGGGGGCEAFVKIQFFIFFIWGGGGQGGCELRSEAFVKIKKFRGGGWVGGGVGSGWMGTEK